MKAIALTPTIGKVKDDIDRVFDRFFGARLLGEPMAPCFPLEKAELEAFVPALDMIETPKEYVVRCEVPGIHSKNLDISLSRQRAEDHGPAGRGPRRGG